MSAMSGMGRLRSTLALAVFSFGLLSTACGGDEDEEKGGTGNGAVFSCISGPSSDGCFEISGLSGSAADTLRDSCNQIGGTAGTGCPRDGLSGICTSTTGGVTNRRYYYGLTPEAVNSMKQSCEESATGGVWSTT